MDDYDEYDPTADFARSIEECYRAIRERVAAGGPGWGGWPTGVHADAGGQGFTQQPGQRPDSFSPLAVEDRAAPLPAPLHRCARTGVTRGSLMAQFPCLPIWTDAWVADTDHLTCEEEGIYFRLLRVMWRTPGCRVPNDVDWLAKHMRMTAKEVVEKVWPIIEQFCNTDGNWVHQKRLRREYTRRFELGAAQSARAKHRRNKKKIPSPELAEIHDPAKPAPAKPPEPEHLSKKEPSFFPTAATPVDSSTSAASKKQPSNPARSLASALPVGALTREPDNEPAEPKKPEEMTLAEINAIRYGRR